MRQITRQLIAGILLSASICAQERSWDMSYGSVLERNNVAKSEWIWTWFRKTNSPAANWIAEWKGKPIVSSILIEHPAFHAAELTTTWLIRTEDEAFYWNEVEGTKWGRHEEPVTLQIYDDIYKQVVSWQQHAPKSAEELAKDVQLPGYIGFLSHFGPDGAKQMLLTIDDFVICLDKTCLPGKIKPGRLMAALDPILIPEAKKNYKHKTEAEIARMTPAQRIDEEIREHDHMMDYADKQGDLIRKYRLLDGLKGASHLVALIDGYQPRRLMDSRFFDAMMMASGIDENLVRLRASPEGRSIVDAVERLAARVDKKDRDQIDATLKSMKGVNFTDDSVRDTLWMKYRIKLSDAELSEFTDYLVKHHPTYPSWSRREHALDHSDINSAGSPAQVFIMKRPTRYHRAYLSFKRLARK